MVHSSYFELLYTQECYCCGDLFHLHKPLLRDSISHEILFILLNDSIITFEAATFLLKHLNVINIERGVSTDGYIKLSLSGPDCIPPTKKLLQFAMMQTNDHDALA